MGVEGIEMSWEELKELGRRVGGVGRVRGAGGSRGSWRCCWSWRSWGSWRCCWSCRSSSSMGSWPNKVNVDRWWVGGMRSLPRQFRF